MAETRNRECIKVRLLGGSTIEIQRKKVIGCCHSRLHPGKLTKKLLEEHDCLGKQCPFLEKYEDAPFWQKQRERQITKAKAKQQKREKKAMLSAKDAYFAKLRDDFQRLADATGSPMDIIRVEHRSPHIYAVFYVSDNRFADGNRFPDFLQAVRKRYTRRRIILRHIRDVDGYFVTRDEFYARKR